MSEVNKGGGPREEPTNTCHARQENTRERSEIGKQGI